MLNRSDQGYNFRFLSHVFLIISLIYAFILCPALNASVKKNKKKNLNTILLTIHKEVMELGKRKNEDFIKREFHIDLDGNSFNREEHIVVLNQTLCDQEFMTVQVTYFKTKDQIVKYPKSVKKLSCYIKEDGIEIKESSYTDKECLSLMSDILDGIRDEKKLLKLLEQDK